MIISTQDRIISLSSNLQIVSRAIGADFVPPADLLWWVDFSDITTLFKDAARTTPVTASNDLILGVTDKSATGAHLSSTLPFVYIGKIKNGLGAARAGIVSKMQSTGFDHTQPLTIYVVCRVTGGSSFQNIVDGTSNREIIYLNGKPGYYAGTLQDGTTSPGANFMLLQATFNGTNSQLLLNGVQETAANPGTNKLKEILLAGTTLSGYICEMLICSSAHTEVHDYLYSKWGMSNITAPTSIGTVSDEAGITGGAVNGVYINGGAIYFDKSVDASISLLSTTFNTKFNNANATVMVKLKPPTGFWANTTQRDLFRFDAGVIFAIDKPASTGKLRAFFSDPSVVVLSSTLSYTDWFTAAMTTDVADNALNLYLDGVDQGAHSGILPNHPGAPTEAFIGATTNGGGPLGFNWWGWISDFIVTYSVTATPTNISDLHAALMAGTLTTSTLDTMFGVGNWSWLKNNSILYG